MPIRLSVRGLCKPREEQAFKPWFWVERLLDARWTPEFCGGLVCGDVWSGPGYRALDVCDPEGNVLQLREASGEA